MVLTSHPKFGIELPQHMGYAALHDLALGSEGLGFDSLWVRDHLIISLHEMSQFQQAYLNNGRRHVSGEYLACVPALAALAAITETVTIGTDVINFPRRHPVDLANEIGAIDEISGGRVILQGAIGHPTRDFEPLDIHSSLRTRGEQLEEAIEIIRLLWRSQEPVDFNGRHYRLDQARIGNHPSRPGGPPIWLGVSKTLRRVARLADGFTLTASMFEPDINSFIRAVRTVRQAAAEAGRNPDEIEPTARFAVVLDKDRHAAKARAEEQWGALWGYSQDWYADNAGDPDDIAALIRPFVEAGARHVLLWPVARLEVSETLQELELFANEVVPRLRGSGASP